MSILSSFVPALKQPESPKGGQSGCHSARLRCWLPCCGFLKNDLLLHRPCEQLISAGGEGKTDPFECPPDPRQGSSEPSSKRGWAAAMLQAGHSFILQEGEHRG